LPFNYRIVPYTSLEPYEGTVRAGEVHRLVNFEGEAYVLKGVDFPGSEYRLAQELSHYKMLSRSRWIPEIGGIVSRQGRREAFLVHYYPGGDLRSHFDADNSTKRRWVIQVATALAELNSMNFFHQDVKCANIVVDGFGDIRIIDLENGGGTDGWTHPDNLDASIAAHEEGDLVISSFVCGDAQPPTLPPIPEWAHMNLIPIPKSEPSVSPPVPEWAPITTSPIPEAGMSTFGFPPPFRSRTVGEKRRFQVYGFGKTVWELYVGKKPIDDDDLLRTPRWVQRLVHECCKEDAFASMDEVIRSLDSQVE
jgi:serine/threonine protein kinase